MPHEENRAAGKKTAKRGREMTVFRKVNAGKILMGKLGFGSDLLEELTSICITQEIALGRVSAFGAVRKARIGFYDQASREYRFSTIDRPLEITNLIGNISRKDEKPVIHAHVTFADQNGKAFGGHCASGTVVFACEFILEIFDGPSFERGFDDETGLPLWTM
jgi:predicted DNA-binding protein with PD1-like motif